MKKLHGFTLIELIVVIVILGILAATAMPRFINMQADARVAAVNGIAGGLRSSVAIVQSAWFLAGNPALTTITAQDGMAITVNASGVPVGTALGIGRALQSTDGFAVDYTTATAVTFRPNGGSANCQAVYNGTTGIVTAAPTVVNCQ